MLNSLARRLALVLSFAGLVALYEDAAQQISATTVDAATALLEGRTLLSGHLLLHGWALSLDSFWALEAVGYAILTPLFGVHLSDLHLLPAVLAAGIFVIAISMVRWHRDGRSARAALLLLAALLLVPSPTFAYFFLQGPWHLSTTLAVLITYQLILRLPNRSGIPLAAMVLTLTLLSDSAALFLGVLPLLVVGAGEVLRTRRLVTGAPLLLSGIGAVVLALIVHFVGRALGMFVLVNRSLVISGHQVGHNFGLLPGRLLALLGIDSLPLGGIHRGSTLFVASRYLVLLLVLFGLLVVVWHLLQLVRHPLRRQAPLPPVRRLEGLLLLSALGDLAFFAIGSANGHVEFTKYLTAGVIFAAILSSRAFGELIGAKRHLLRRWVLPLTAAVASVICATQFVLQLTKPAPAQRSHQLATYLVAHHLREGVASYPIANLVTVDSGLVLLVRPVTTTAKGQLIAFDRQRDSAWYRSTFSYLVYDTSVPWHGVNLQSAIRSLGAPNRVIAVGSYRVLLYPHGFHIRVPAIAPSAPLQIHFR